MIEQMNSTFKEQSESKTLSAPAKESWAKPDLSAPQVRFDTVQICVDK